MKTLCILSAALLLAGSLSAQMTINRQQCGHKWGYRESFAAAYQQWNGSPFVMEADFRMPESKPADFIARLPGFLRPLAARLATPVPKIRTAQCVGCGKCAESCPQHTITIENRKAVIHYDKCIRCYCCHEMCPKHVIDIRRLSLFRH